MRAREGRVRLILAPEDIAAARREGVTGALLACEGGDALEGRRERVKEFFDLGVRSIRLLSTSQHTYVGLGGFGIEITATEGLEG